MHVDLSETQGQPCNRVFLLRQSFHGPLVVPVMLLSWHTGNGPSHTACRLQLKVTGLEERSG